MKKVYLIAFTITVLLVFSACSGNEPTTIEICKEDSTFIDYYEDSGVVHFVCKIVLQNNTSAKHKVKLYGFSKEDVDGGLLLNPKLTGYNIDGQNDTFQLDSNSRSELTVVFLGEYAGVLQKADRLIPDVLEIEIVE